MVEEGLLLPERAVLVHVGPYKTGTTALQTSLHAQRAELEAAGVTYPGTRHRQMRPSWALVGRSRLGHPDVPREEWEELVAQTRAAPGRVMISSEDLSSADPGQAATLVADLGPERVHVLLVVRRLDRLLPSSWQERVKSVSDPRSYGDWLREVLTEPQSRAAEVFWGHQSVAAQLALWGGVLPPGRITIVVADEDDRALLHRVTERLLGLPAGMLRLTGRPNASLTWNRAELVRGLNVAMRAGRWDERLHRRLVFSGVVAGLLHAPADARETPIPAAPDWAAPRIRELGEQRVGEVAAAARGGVRVVGDPGMLRSPEAPGPVAPAPTAVAMDSAVAAVTGLLEAWSRRREGRGG